MINKFRVVKRAFGAVPPRVLPQNSLIRFSLEILDPFFSENAASIRVKYIREDWRMDDGRTAYFTPGQEHYWQYVKHAVSGGILLFELAFNGENEHCVKIYADDGETECCETLSFYTLADDLIRLRPYKGSIHTHSTGSDGLCRPEIVPAYMRRAGFDFTAVTDHKKYEPSLLAAASMRRFDSGLEVFSGEEAESYGVGINHILSLGASESISRWEYDPDGDFLKRTEQIRETLSDLPEHEAFYTAQFEAIAEKIKETGGISVFCHPYWKQNARYASTPLLTDAIMRRGRFDALEVGNYNVERTALANAKVMEMIRCCGFRKPLIGSSDWHGRPTQKDNIDCTVIFADSPSFADFAEAVRAERCVAVGGYADAIPFGSFRLVKYTLFLMEHYFAPLHDPVCAEQGGLLLRAVEGDADVIPRIRELKETLAERQTEFFGVRK